MIRAEEKLIPIRTTQEWEIGNSDRWLKVLPFLMVFTYPDLRSGVGIPKRLKAKESQAILDLRGLSTTPKAGMTRLFQLMVG